MLVMVMLVMVILVMVMSVMVMSVMVISVIGWSSLKQIQGCSGFIKGSHSMGEEMEVFFVSV
jgi:hypothetical protein